MKPIVIFAAVFAFTPHGVHTAEAGVPAAPQIQCQIKMPRWCIPQFGGTIQLSGDARRRVWALTDPLFMKDGPLTIVEIPDCDGDESAPSFTSSRRDIDQDGHAIEIYLFRVGAGLTCSLEFHLPSRDGKVDPIYRHTMLYGIITCRHDRCTSSLADYMKRR